MTSEAGHSLMVALASVLEYGAQHGFVLQIQCSSRMEIRPNTAVQISRPTQAGWKS